MPVGSVYLFTQSAVYVRKGEKIGLFVLEPSVRILTLPWKKSCHKRNV